MLLVLFATPEAGITESVLRGASEAIRIMAIVGA